MHGNARVASRDCGACAAGGENGQAPLKVSESNSMGGMEIRIEPMAGVGDCQVEGLILEGGGHFNEKGAQAGFGTVFHGVFNERLEKR